MPATPTRRPSWRWKPRVHRPRKLGQHWNTLPVLATLGPLKVRWAGPLVDANQAVLLADKSEQTAFDADWGVETWPPGAFARDDGSVEPDWARALLDASRELALRHSGPEEEWLSWLCFALSGPHGVLKQRWEEHARG